MQLAIERLKQVNARTWRVTVLINGQPSVDVLNNLLKAYQRTVEYSMTLGVGFARTVSYDLPDDIWQLIKHCFTNWQQMEAYANDEAREHGQERERHTQRCATCGHATGPLRECLECHKTLCSNCFIVDQAIHDMYKMNGQHRQQYYGSPPFSATWDFATDDASTSQTHAVPIHVQAAYRVLGLPTTQRASREQIMSAFRGKVKAASDGKGGYRGDMDALTKAKEQALSDIEQRVR